MQQKYSSWSLEKLKKERAKIDKAIATAEKRDKKTALAKMAVVARQNGFELHELIGKPPAKSATAAPKPRKTVKKKKTRAKVAPKYRNPADETQTWTGRGRQPAWVKELVEGGANVEDFRIATNDG